MNIIIIIFLYIFFYAALFIVSGLWKRTSIGKKLFRKKKKAPIREKLLRSPGDFLRKKEHEAVFDLAYFIGISPLPISVVCSILISVRGLNLATQVVLAFIGIISSSYLLLKARKAFKSLHSIWLGLDGELASAQELNQLTEHGYYVYHDFPAENFNIDHVIIGPVGVFAVETKVRLKPAAKGLSSAKVRYDGEVLRFPDGFESNFITQAQSQAKWLAGFLEQSVGIPIPVKAMLALPGWMVDRLTADERVLVINPKEAVTILLNKAKILNGQTIQ